MERRTVIQLGVSALAIGALGSCSTNSPSTTSSPAPVQGPVRIPLSDIPLGGGTILATEQIIATQATAGEYRAFSAVCQHKQCLLDSIDNQDIVCPCHGSRYSIVDGAVVQGPTTKPLIPAASTTIEGSDLVVVL